MSKKLTASIVNAKTIHETANGLFSLKDYAIQFEKHDGSTTVENRLVFERGNTVGILPYDPIRDEVVLVNEIRPAMLVNGDDPFNPALPAGIVDAGETSLQAATRELREETGFSVDNICIIHPGAYVSPGGTSEKMALAVAIIDSSKAGSGIFGKASEGESIKTEVISSGEFINRAERGELYDMKTVTMAFWLAAHKKELRPAPISRFFSQVSKKFQSVLGISVKPRSSQAPIQSS